MPQYRVLGDVLVPSEVLVEADSPSEAVEKLIVTYPRLQSGAYKE